MFADYTPGMDKDRLVNLVCNRLLNNPVEDRETKIVTERHLCQPSAWTNTHFTSLRQQQDSQKPFTLTSSQED